jgi:hypothetical protein
MDPNAPLHHVYHYGVPGFNSCPAWVPILSPTIRLSYGYAFETSKSISRRSTRRELVSTIDESLKNSYEFDQNFFGAFVLLAQVPILIDSLQGGMDGTDLPFVRFDETGKPELQCLGTAVPLPILENIYRLLRDPRKPWSRIKGQTLTHIKENLPPIKVRPEAFNCSVVSFQGSGELNGQILSVYSEKLMCSQLVAEKPR